MVKSGRMADMLGLTLRESYLDTEVTDFLTSLDFPMKRAGGLSDHLKGKIKTKFLHRKAMEDLLPPEILTKPKQGGFVPVMIFLKNQELRNRIYRHLLNSRVINEYFKTDPLKSLFENYERLQGKTIYWHRIRGPGAFERAARGIENLAAAGLSPQTAVAFTEMEHNVDELPELLEWLDGIGVRRVTSASVMPHGRAARAPGVRPPEPSQYGRLLDRYRADEAFRRRCREGAEVAALRWSEGRDPPPGSVCSLARTPYVSPAGRLYPCPLLHDRTFAVGGALERPLATLLAEGRGRWAELQRISRVRAGTLASCAGCARREHCGGGCMGRAWAAHGDLIIDLASGPSIKGSTKFITRASEERGFLEEMALKRFN